MSPSYSLLPITFGLGALFSWGTSDFLGGYAARRANAFLLTTIAHGSGLFVMIVLALAAAVLGAAIPTAFNVLTEGSPGFLHIAGFAMAGIGILLISRTEDNVRADGLWPAVLAGIGFAGFFLCIKQAGNSSALWIVV